MEQTVELKTCPFCGGNVHIVICDDEGNHHTDEYENEPWSGLGFRLEHNESDNPDCPIAHEKYEGFGLMIYDTRAEAARAWNRRIG